MNGASEPVGTIDVAVAHATRLLATRPALAAQQATEILKVAPGHPAATLLLGVARRGDGDPLRRMTCSRGSWKHIRGGGWRTTSCAHARGARAR